MQFDDRHLVEAFQAGDELAFISLYNKYKGPIYSFCANMLFDKDAASDVMQDTFLRVYENKLRLQKTSAFRSWVFTIARNQCLNTIKRNKRMVRMNGETDEQLPAMQTQHTPADKLEKSEEIALVNRLLADLKPEYREVLVLREYLNLAYEDIAAVTRCTVSSVKSRLFKARRKLAESHNKPKIKTKNTISKTINMNKYDA